MVDKEIKRLSVDLTENMHNQAKAKAAQEGLTISEVIRALLFGWLTPSRRTNKSCASYYTRITLMRGWLLVVILKTPFILWPNSRYRPR